MNLVTWLQRAARASPDAPAVFHGRAVWATYAELAARLTAASAAEASVVGRPDAQWGETVVAFIVARGEAPPPAELDRLRIDHIARFKRPKEYRFVQASPKNHYGKVVKAELRASLSE